MRFIKVEGPHGLIALSPTDTEAVAKAMLGRCDLSGTEAALKALIVALGLNTPVADAVKLLEKTPNKNGT